MSSFTRRLFVLFLSLSLALLPFASASAGGTITNLRDLQDLIRFNAPEKIMASGTYHVSLSGTISEIHWCGANNHYQMTLLIDDANALRPIGSDLPQLSVHFRLHVDQIPFAVGDLVSVSGSLNELYSSAMVPMILAELINGSDDF